MTLGGFAVAIGMVVDDAIVDVENVFRRLKENANLAKPKPKLKVIAQASSEIRSSIFYATILIVLVFLPLLGLSGVEGKIFAPIAIATIVSMLSSFFVSLTIIPVLASIFINPKAGREHRDGFIIKAVKAIFTHTILRLSLAQPVVIIVIALLLLIGGFSLYPTMSNNFLPSFREPSVMVAMTASPGTSLDQTSEITAVADKLLLEIPEIKSVGRRIGRAERGEHVVPVSTAEIDIHFRESKRPREQVLEEIREKMATLPGTFSVLSTPLADRIGHMLSGVSAPVALKIYGNDLDQLQKTAKEIVKVAKEIPGLEQTRMEQQGRIPQLRIEINRDKALRYGVNPGELNQELASLTGGEVVAQVYQEQRIYDLVIRFPQEWRSSAAQLENYYITTASGRTIPLKYVADIRPSTGPNSILRENTQRRIVVSITPTGNDLITLVDQLREKVTEEVTLPEGYFLSYEGEYLAQKEAAKRILVISIIVLVVITLLLYHYFKSASFTIQVLTDIPLALVGGIIMTKWSLDNISIATMVGFIAVAGISVRNSIMMISHYLHLMRHEGYSFSRELVIKGSQERLIPVLMTALSAIIALIPLLLAAEEPGKEILNPVANVIVGGLIASTIFGLAVTPALFWMFGESASRKAMAENAPATH